MKLLVMQLSPPSRHTLFSNILILVVLREESGGILYITKLNYDLKNAIFWDVTPLF
jgi:hypothetical protein